MNQRWVAIVAIVVIVLAGFLILRQTVLNPENQPRKGPTVEEMIRRIEENPNMPPQAKAAAIAQLRQRSGGSSGGLGGATADQSSSSK